MKKIIMLIGCCLLLQLSYAQNKSQLIDEVIGRYASLNKFNGSVMVAEKGQLLLQKGYGYRDVPAQLPNDPETIFEVGSITKEFTATIILKLAESKKLSLTDRLSKYEPGFPKGDSITIQNLLTQTSGIFNYTDTKDIWEKSSKPTDEHTVVEFLKSKPLGFRPGEKFSYSNSNYMLLAYIIQKVNGKTYEAVVSELIFKPLHMARSGFHFAALKDENKAKGYWTFTPAEYREGPPTDPTQFIGSGEIYSTVNDLYKWHQALQAGKILSAELLQRAYNPFKKEYGYGWEMMDSIGGKQVVGHGGRMLSGFESAMRRVPADDVFIILLDNNADGPYVNTISSDLLAILYGKHYDLPEKPIELTTEQMNAYTGKYGESKERYMEIKIINGHLFAKDRENMMQLIPLKNNYFRFMEHEGEQIDLQIGMDGNGVAQSISVPGRNGQINTIKRLIE